MSGWTQTTERSLDSENWQCDIFPPLLHHNGHRIYLKLPCDIEIDTLGVSAKARAKTI